MCGRYISQVKTGCFTETDHPWALLLQLKQNASVLPIALLIVIVSDYQLCLLYSICILLAVAVVVRIRTSLHRLLLAACRWSLFPGRVPISLSARIVPAPRCWLRLGSAASRKQVPGAFVRETVADRRRALRDDILRCAQLR